MDIPCWLLGVDWLVKTDATPAQMSAVLGFPGYSGRSCPLRLASFGHGGPRRFCFVQRALLSFVAPTSKRVGTKAERARCHGHKMKNHLITTMAALALIALLAAILLFLTMQRREEPDLVWTAININSFQQQGDANLLQVAGDVNILIDAGHILYAEKLLAFLRDRNALHFRAIILSHAHNDHYGALPYLLRNGISADAVYFNPPAPELVAREYWGCNMQDIEEILRECAARDVPVIAMKAGTEWALGRGILMRVLYVFDGIDTPVGPTDINDTSAVIMVEHGEMRYLFPGDLNQSLGQYITENADIVPIRANVLKAPHHGTEGLAPDEFFHAVSPGAMIVPAPAGLWMSDRSARVRNLAGRYPAYVNGLHGHITVKSFGDRFEIETETH